MNATADVKPGWISSVRNYVCRNVGSYVYLAKPDAHECYQIMREYWQFQQGSNAWLNFSGKTGCSSTKTMASISEPKWFPVIYVLHNKGVLSVVEIASEIGFTHPSTITLAERTGKTKMIRSGKDKSDERKRLIQLTEKGKELVGKMGPVWNLMIGTITEIINTKNNLMQAIDEVEGASPQKRICGARLGTESIRRKEIHPRTESLCR